MGSHKVRVELYYESQCPGCRSLITTSFADAFATEGFLKMADIAFVPYGNAHETGSASEGWTFSCQHGETECVYNAMETCGLSYISSTQKAFDFVNCIEHNDESRTSHDYDSVLDKCATEASIAKSQSAQIKTCYTGSQGNSLEHAMALSTENLSPSHEYVPWVVGQGVHSDEIQN